MERCELAALTNALIALCQREGVLSTNSDELADELQSLAADEVYISKSELLDFLE